MDWWCKGHSYRVVVRFSARDLKEWQEANAKNPFQTPLVRQGDLEKVAAMGVDFWSGELESGVITLRIAP